MLEVAIEETKLPIFGNPMVISPDGNTMVIKKSETNYNEVFILNKNNDEWKVETSFIGGKVFGSALAIDNKTLVIGDYMNETVFVYEKVDEIWTLKTTLQAPDQSENDWFGASVAITPEIIAVGAYLKDFEKKTHVGAVYLFTKFENQWEFEAKLLPSDLVPKGWFGTSLAFNNKTIAVGASSSKNGAVYIFSKKYNKWVEKIKLVPSNSISKEEFGTSLAFSPDGKTIAIGAPSGGYSRTKRCGAVYIFNSYGKYWIEKTKLLPSKNSDFGAFGKSLAFSSNGKYLVIGAPFMNDLNGAVYVYSTSDYKLNMKLTTSFGEDQHRLGNSVAISENAIYCTTKNNLLKFGIRI